MLVEPLFLSSRSFNNDDDDDNDSFVDGNDCLRSETVDGDGGLSRPVYRPLEDCCDESGTSTGANSKDGDCGSKLVMNLLLSSRIIDAIIDGGASSFNNTDDNVNESGTDSSDGCNNNGGNCNERGASAGADVVGPFSF